MDQFLPVGASSESAAPPLGPQHEAKVPQPDATPDDKLAERYSSAIEALVLEAADAGKVRLLVEVITWQLSRIVGAYGAIAAGHLLERLGYFIYHRAAQERAQAEAEEAKKAGREPN
jgi:hypothetical protein